MTSEGPADCTLTVLRALSDPTRLRLFRALRDKERCVTELVASENLTQPLVSHHLAALARAGLVSSHRAEGFTLYAVDPSGLRTAMTAMGRLLDPDQLPPAAFPGGNPACCRQDEAC